MMTTLRALVIAFSMYSKIPMPQFAWKDEEMKYMLCFFPFIGTAIGIVFLVAEWICRYLGFGNSFTAMVLFGMSSMPVPSRKAVLARIPIARITASDALSSWRDREKRLEILKDSHAGAFAVITACVYFLVLFGTMRQITEVNNRTAMYLLACSYMVSRCLSGIGVITLPKANASGTVAEFSRKAEDKKVHNILVIYLVILAVVMIWIQPVWGVSMLGTALLVFAFYRHKAMKYFGGTTGDLSGYFLCLCVIWMPLALAVVMMLYKV